MKILLVAAALEGSIRLEDRPDWVEASFPGLIAKAYMPPLHMATIAALTPDEHEVLIHDEAVHGLIGPDSYPDTHFDIVGVGGYSNHLSRARKVAREFRGRGSTVVCGGAGATDEPETVREDFDVLFLGEAELTWPQFLDDFTRGEHAAEYRGDRFVELDDSPLPDWKNLTPILASAYRNGGVQINRGCPHSCEFCNIWLQFGRKMRSKPIARILDELRVLKQAGMERVMFCSDNFVGNPRFAKELLAAVIELNASWDERLRFSTELTMIIARDEELLRLLAAANFPSVFIGIETPNLDALRETRKLHNFKGDPMVDQCRAIAAHGIYVTGSFIVGFDHDTPEVFDLHYQFIQDACIPVPRLNVLYAGRGTALRDRMLAEGRVIDVAKSFAAVSAVVPGDSFVTNIIPAKLSRVELYEGYLALNRKVWTWPAFEQRVMGFLDALRHPPQQPLSPALRERARHLRGGLEATLGEAGATIRRLFARVDEVDGSLVPAIIEQIALMMFETNRLPVLVEDLERHIEREQRLERAGSMQLKTRARRSLSLEVLQ